MLRANPPARASTKLYMLWRGQRRATHTASRQTFPSPSDWRRSTIEMRSSQGQAEAHSTRSASRRGLTEQSQTRHAAVGVDVQASEGRSLRISDLEHMTRVRLERRIGHERAPLRALRIEVNAACAVAHLEHAASRRIALEMIRVQLDALDGPAPSETDGRPVVSGAVVRFGLPAVFDLGGVARQD